tara:strand:+ start:259 stop:2904 length:2646 start_codon:yes stop_codon:yes gene_type:complete
MSNDNNLGFDDESLRSLTEQMKDVANLTGKAKTNAQEFKSEVNKLISATAKLSQQEEGLTRLTDNQLDSQAKKAKLAIDELKIKTDSLRILKSTSEIEKEFILSARDKFKREDLILKKVQDQVQERKNANKSLGLAGALTKTLASVGGEVAKAMNIDEIAADMQEFADKTASATERASKLQVLGVGIGSAFRNLGEGLSDPLVLFNFLLGAANKTSQRITDIQNSLGASYGEASRLNLEFQKTAALSGETSITTDKLAKTFGTITNELGMSAEILGSDALVSATHLTNELGMSAKEATNLTVMSRLQGKNTEDILKSTISQVESVKNQNKTSINTKAVLSDISNVSSTISARLGENPVKLAAAATQARLLGTDLEGVSKMADSLLNFESSISAELEAELLTGKSLNLEKARELALVGDLEGVGKEIGKQEAVKNAFASKNVLAQKAIAKALGISVDELAQMNRQQELATLGAESFKATYGEQAYNAMLAKSAQDRFNDSLDKVKSILGGIGTALAPVLDGLVFLLDNPLAPYLVSALIAMKAMKALKLGSMFSGMLSSVKGLGGFVSKISGGMSKIGGADEASKLSNKAKPGAGKGIKDNLQGLAGGLRSMGTGNVLKGIGNLAVFAFAGVAAIPSLAFLFPFSILPGEAVKKNMQSLAAGLRSFGTGNVMKGIGAFTLLSLAGIAMIPGSVGLLMFGGAAYVAAAGITVLTPALIALGTAMSTGVGALGLAALVVAAIGLGAAFALVGVGALAMGKGIKLSAEGFAIMVPSILELIPALPSLFLLGGALLSISAGLASMGIAGLLAMPTILALTALGSVSEGLDSIFGGDENSSSSKSSEMAGVEKKLDTLIALIEKGGDVYIDGAKVGKSLQLAGSKVG